MDYIHIVNDCGAAFDGVTPDDAAWATAIGMWKATGKPIVCPKGGSVVTDTVLLNNSDGSEGFRQGPHLIGAGPMDSYIIGKNISNKPTVKIDGRNPNAQGNSYFSFTRFEGFGIKQQGCVNSDGILYHATWHSSFEHMHLIDLSGAGFRASNNPMGWGDNNASAHITFDNDRVEGCAGPAWTSEGSNGGITNHVFNQFYSKTNAHTFGVGQIDIDGLIHGSFHMCCVCAFNNLNVPLVRFRGSHTFPDTISFSGGEYGNAGGTHFHITTVTGLQVTNIRQVRRMNETAARYGFFIDNANTLVRDFNFWGTTLAVNNTNQAPFTWMKKTSPAGTPLDRCKIGYSPSISNAPGVVLYEGF